MYHTQDQYLFTSARLGFRPWLPTDLDFIVELNANKKVMEFFPNALDKAQSQVFLDKMQLQFNNYGFCYFAVELLTSGKLVGAIGLCWQTYEAKFTPCVDIGWRILPEYWNLGIASEGAKRCLEIASTRFGLKQVYSVAPVVNIRSIRVMEKIGMRKWGEFIHPALLQDLRLQNCVVYVMDGSY